MYSYSVQSKPLFVLELSINALSMLAVGRFKVLFQQYILICLPSKVLGQLRLGLGIDYPADDEQEPLSMLRFGRRILHVANGSHPDERIAA